MRIATRIAVWLLFAASSGISFGQVNVGAGPLPESPGSIAFSADGSRLACSIQYKIHIRSAATGALQRTIDAPARINDIAWVPGQSQVAAGLSDGRIYVLDAQSGESVQQIAVDHGGVHQLTFSDDGMLLLIACEAANPDALTVTLWDFQQRKVIKTLAHEERALSGGVAFSPDQTTVSFGINPPSGRSEVRRWHFGRKEWKTPCVVPEGMLKSVAYGPEGDQIVCGGWQSPSQGRAQGIVILWNTTDATPLQTKIFPQLGSIQVAFAPDGDSLVGGASSLTEEGDGKAVVLQWPLGEWNAEWRALTDSLSINSIAFSPDGRTLAFSGSAPFKREGVLKFVDPTSGEIIASFWPIPSED